MLLKSHGPFLPDRLPIGGAVLQLRDASLPDPGSLESYLAVSTSHPRRLVGRWMKHLGETQATRVCHHGVITPQTIVAVEPGFGRGLSERFKDAVDPSLWRPHPVSGFVVWLGTHKELIAFLDENPLRRVQDPGAAYPVQVTSSLSPRCCVDYCAGRGTKTRQLASLHPEAKIFATDTDSRRFVSLRESLVSYGNVVVVDPSKLLRLCAGGSVDLLLLDVPCSNTAVLGRRPEARLSV